ncbi:hypothetical protein PYW07_005087 [Mythimna separata]|uniref:Uncharacterized protein n=1 Tax=Mythimna separata TaxID=271217 RepID=A0AAD7YDU3_MYTSE|nr:hypothetical protein PYW07_005087 [Mythimna separata]
MKLILLLCVVLAAGGINAYVAQITKMLKVTQTMNNYITECIEEGEFELTTEVVAEGLSDEDKKDLVEKEGMEQVTRCFFHKAGILEPDGKLNRDAAKTILLLIGVEEKAADELLKKCTSITGFDAKATAYAIFKCFDDGVKN